MEKSTSLSTIWHRIFNKLNKAKIEYVLVGGAALVAHGLPRSTLDIDIFVTAGEDILNKLFEISDELGLKSKERSLLQISHLPKLFANQWLCFSYKGHDVLDVFLADQKDFNRLYKNSQLKKDERISIRVASLKDIAAMKKRIARSVDLADLDLIGESMKLQKR